MNAGTLDLHTVRVDPYERERFLNTLLRNNAHRLFRAIARVVPPGNQLFVDLLNDDCPQAFLLAASMALDRFNTIDDGRGKNDCAAFCSWEGLNAVRMTIRSAVRASRRNRNFYPVDAAFLSSDLFIEKDHYDPRRSQVVVALRENPQGLYARDTIQMSISHEMIATFLERIPRADDAQVAELLVNGFGPSGVNRGPSEYRGRRRNYLRDLEQETGLKQHAVLASLRRLRAMAREHFA